MRYRAEATVSIESRLPFADAYRQMNKTYWVLFISSSDFHKERKSRHKFTIHLSGVCSLNNVLQTIVGQLFVYSVFKVLVHCHTRSNIGTYPVPRSVLLPPHNLRLTVLSIIHRLKIYASHVCAPAFQRSERPVVGTLYEVWCPIYKIKTPAL